jgi:flagellar export protein FliJ
MPQYRLQALLEIRERAEEEAKDVFAKAMQALRNEEQALQQHEDELARMVEDRHRRRKEYADKLASGEMKITDQAAAQRYLERLKEREQEQKGKIDAQKEQVREAEKRLKRTQDALVKATQDLKALQKHREKWLEDWKKERALKEEDMLDEIAQTIFQQQQKGR